MWGTSWRQRLRLLPLYFAMRAADRLAATLPLRRTRSIGPWRPGLSVIIPDRDAPLMLAEALQALHGALREVREPVQVIVVANGARRAAYRDIETRFPAVDWVHDDAPLGFAGAIERGLVEARYDGTFLLNNDMALAPPALVSLLPLRDAGVFAIASQILQQDAAGRREETGFTDWYVDRAGMHLYHAPAPAHPDPVPHLCAGGGAALFRTELLRAYIGDSRAYDPFYWEDVEWSVRAWRDGYSVLFCGASVARHRHRATTARFYASDELDRIVERNRVLFEARHGVSGFDSEWLMARICGLPYASQRELAQLRQAVGVLRTRRTRKRPPQPSSPPHLADPGRDLVALTSSYSFRLRAPTAGQRRLLVVTPFAAFPPRHGGARRVAETIRGLRNTFDIALVTDEASLYDARSFADFDGLCEVRLVQRVAEDEGPPDAGIAARMRRHCHPALASAVDETLRSFRPDLVQIEHAELAPLVRRRSGSARWLLDLHDAIAPGDFADHADAAAFAADLAAYDAVTVCSEEDRALVRHPNVTCVPNGAALEFDSYRPSSSSSVLFIGPFRYRPNREGIVRFLHDAWPAIRAAVPAATLTILGGDEHVKYTSGEPAFAQPGVIVLGHRDNVPHLLAQCALTINPLAGIRGSAVKLVESLAAGRVCVSTRDGARGIAPAMPALVIVDDAAAMAAPIARLLVDSAERHRLEVPDADALVRYGWPQAMTRLRSFYDELLNAT
jgi:GT2 family glycosyltransferase/glycosyltransferase involved in cell wall biosynthesis